MTGDPTVQRLRAWADGKPLPRGATRHVHIARNADILVVAFVRMGGESSPWGIAFGHPDQEPTILTVPEARNRTMVGDMAAEFAPALLSHCQHPDHEPASPAGPEHTEPLRQLWLPTGTHLDMLHFVAYAYTFTRVGERERAKTLNKLGRVAGWLFREAHRPGQQTVMVATDTLQVAYTFPAEEVRQAHLGFLLAWLETKGGREARLNAAQRAEQLAVATSLDPVVERDGLQPALEQWHDAERGKDSKARSKHQEEIAGLLRAELVRRFGVTVRAIEALRRDKRRVNQGLDALIAVSREEAWFQFLRKEHDIDDSQDGPAITLSPETDRYPALAASRYFVHEASEELHLSALVHDDEELQDEVISQGQAIRGVITAVEDRDPGRRLEPVWTISVSDGTPLRVREGSWLCVAGLPKRTARVRSIARAAPGKLDIEVEITGWKKKPKDGPRGVPAATDDALVGTRVTLVPSSAEGMFRRKSQKTWERDTPGGWLTHSPPSVRGAALPEGVGENAKEVTTRLADGA